MFFLRLNLAQTVMMFLGGTGLGPSASISKNSGGFASASNTPAEVAFGWYSLLLDSGETDTPGPLIVHTNAGSPSDFEFQVGAVLDANVVGWRGNVPAALNGSQVQAHLVDCDSGAIVGTSLNNDVVAKLFSGVALTESYAADGAPANPGQLLYALLSALSEFSISGGTMTCKKLDGTTTALVYTLSPAGAPTGRTRSA